MARHLAGPCRPIERLISSIEFVEVVEGGRLLWAHFYIVGERLVIMVPEELTGVHVREGMIARQALLVAIRALGEDGARAAFSACVAALWEPRGVAAS